MTVTTTTTKNSYSANGTLHSFAYGFKIFADADLTVIVRSATGSETTKTLNTHYVVTNAGTDSGGNVLFKFNTGTSSDAHFSTTDHRPANGETVVILRTLTKSQGTDYVENDPFPSTSHEDALDRLTFITQEVQEELDRTIKLSKTNTMTSPEFTTSATDRASKILAFDSSGELSVTQELGTFKGDSATTTTAAFKQRDIIKATTTAQLNNIYICVADSVIGDALTDTDHFAVLVDAVAAAASATTATTKAGEASTSASTATTKAGEAATSATNAATTLTTFQRQYHGAAGSDPSSNVDAGDLYFKTDGSGLKVYNGSAWEDIKPTSSEQTNINTVAGANSNISALAASAVIADMALLGTTDVVADMAQLANSTIIDDLAILATTDIVTDLAILATSANVTAMGLLGTSANVTAQGLLGTSAVIEDMGLLGVAAVIEDMALLGVAGVIEDMGILGTSANVTAMSNVSGSIANVNTVATNIASVNNFADVYRIASSAPSTSLTAGDLYFNTSTNVLNVYGDSGWQNAGSSVNGTSQRYHYDIGGAVTSVTGSDANSNTLAYDAGYVDVYVNGVRMSTADVTVTSGDTVTFTEALASGDEVDIVAYGTFAVASLNADNLDSGTVPDARITGAYTGITNLTATGVGTFGSLDISGDIDVDGTTNLDAVDIDGAVDMASTLQVDGAITSSAGMTITTADNTNQLTLLSTDADANVGPNLNLYRNSGSPADNDVLGLIIYNGRNDNSQDVIYARQLSYIKDASDGTEDGQLTLQTIVAGTIRDRLNINPTEIVLNEDSQDLDFRVESNGQANMLFVDGGNDTVSFQPNSGNLAIKAGRVDSTNNVRLEAGGTTSTYLEYRGYLGHIFDVNTTERMRISATSTSLITGLRVSRGGTQVTTKHYTFSNSLGIEDATQSAFSTATSSVLCVGQMVGARSINASGTINASGADYAEYENNGGLVIPKGEIVGFKADGILTLTFAEAVRFAVKSTDPSYVGGDTWADEEPPEKNTVEWNEWSSIEPQKETTEWEEWSSAEPTEVSAEWNSWYERTEAKRVLVDRIAYSGKVPCNIKGATSGDYIIAVALDDGSIAGQAVSDPDFSQYKLSVGRVNRILDDGRAEIAVIIH